MMNRARIAVVGGILAAVAFATWPAATFAGSLGTPEAPVPHFELRSSAPMADSTVSSASEVRLWFTQAPQDGTTQIRVRREGALLEVSDVPTSNAQPAPDDPMVYFVSADRPLGSGHYEVRWRSMAADGHVVEGDFLFHVAGEGAPN